MIADIYGRIAASGVLEHDDAKVDDQARVYSTIANMDELELVTLLCLTAPAAPREWSIDQGARRAERRGDLARDLPQLGALADSVVARLDGAGLINTRTQAGPNYGGPGFAVTPYAFMCRSELMRGEDAGT